MMQGWGGERQAGLGNPEPFAVAETQPGVKSTESPTSNGGILLDFLPKRDGPNFHENVFLIPDLADIF